MIQLREYQSALVQQVREAFRKHKHVIMQSPTASGKTFIFSYIAQNAYKKGRRIMICSDRTELLSQNGGSLEKFDLNPEYISPKTKQIPQGQVCVSMTQTIIRRIKSKPEWLEFLHAFDLLIIDEAHCQIANYLLQSLSSKTYVIGATATPIRSSGQRQLGEDYSHIITGCSVKHLISLGFIVPCNHYTVDAPDLSSIPIDTKKGDYNTKQMSKVFEQKEKYEGIVKEWLRITPNTKTICFCASSEQAIQITKEFTEVGVAAKYLLSGSFEDDDMYSGERSELIEELRTGDLTVLVNVGIAVAGLDVPNLETCITAFATVSLSKWLQALGRCARISPGKAAYSCLDFGGNVQRLGLYQDERRWGLFYETKNGGTSIAPTKLCPEDKTDIHGIKGCGGLILSTAKKCPFCGYYFANKREIYEVELSLVTEDGRDEKEHIDVYIANRIKLGWSNNRILATICAKNSDNPKKAYMEAIKYLRTKEGKPIDPKSWFFFSNNILKSKNK